MPCLYTTQIVEHADCLLRHGSTNSITGQLIEGTLEIAKAEVSLPGSFFSFDYMCFGLLLTNSWLKGVWHEFHDNQIQFTK